jgi:hypothetical protein
MGGEATTSVLVISKTTDLDENQYWRASMPDASIKPPFGPHHPNIIHRPAINEA